ncbi:MAG: hypothetical protein AA908_02990 [Chlorobi bacterium NICIL-2]|nr:MAG: hypothetical protein AA908_02990 [Chlorobi bacterium NICIL-2]
MHRTLRQSLSIPAILAGALLLGGCNSCNRPHASPQQQAEYKSTQIPQPEADRLYALVAQQLQWGPRVPGTAAHDSCRRWIIEQLKMYADTTLEQPFTASVYGRRYSCTNIIARLFPERGERVLLCAHWDSRPQADEDPIPENRSLPIPGANDGASGVAVVLEIVRLLRQQPPHGIGVDVVFFDAEDMGAPSDAAMFCLGSKYFAANFPLPVRPRYGILFDLVGDHQARFFIEETSQQAAPALVERLWKLGRLYGNGTFVEQRGGSVVDDHHALIELGIPTVDIIDLELVGNQSPIERRRYWHTRSDDMRNISGQTLRSVATVVLALLYSDTPFPL